MKDVNNDEILEEAKGSFGFATVDSIIDIKRKT